MHVDFHCHNMALYLFAIVSVCFHFVVVAYSHSMMFSVVVRAGTEHKCVSFSIFHGRIGKLSSLYAHDVNASGYHFQMICSLFANSCSSL